MLFTRYQYTKAVKASTSYSDTCRTLGVCVHGSTYRKVRREIIQLGLTTDHFNHTNRSGSTKKLLIEDILVEGSGYNSSRLKKRLVKEGLKEDTCEECGGGNSWNNKPLVIQLDHINGVHSDNRIDNLRLLCPNCHSQTDTFTSKNRKR